MSNSVYICTDVVSVTSSATSSVTASCDSGAYVQVPPPLVMDSTAFASLAGVTIFAFLAAYAIRVVVRLIWRP